MEKKECNLRIECKRILGFILDFKKGLGCWQERGLFDLVKVHY